MSPAFTIASAMVVLGILVFWIAFVIVFLPCYNETGKCLILVVWSVCNDFGELQMGR
jgi:hypothetical protein